MKRILLLTALCLAFAALVSGEPAEEFALGIEHYKSGEFQEAAAIWEGLISSGVEDPRLHYNLGNVYFRMDNLGPAVLNYERSLRMEPNNRLARENLEYIKLHLKDRFERTEQGTYTNLLSSIFNFFSLNTLAWLLLGFWLLLNTLWTLYLVRKERAFRTIVTFSASIVAAILLILFPLFTIKAYQVHFVRSAVMLSPSTTAKSAPQDDATDLFVVHEGTRVRLLESVGTFNRVTLPNGLTGFIPEDTFEEI